MEAHPGLGIWAMRFSILFYFFALTGQLDFLPVLYVNTALNLSKVSPLTQLSLDPLLGFVFFFLV